MNISRENTVFQIDCQFQTVSMSEGEKHQDHGGLSIPSCSLPTQTYEYTQFAGLIQLWRGGCIIQSDGIADLLESAYRDDSHSKTDLLEHPNINKELVDSYSANKNVVLKCTEADCYIPSISASLV
jgi:6-phosphogluconate dehydrogenase